MPSTPEPKEYRRAKLFFLLGVVFELVLILLLFLVLEGGLSVHIQNFVLVAHYPIIRLIEGLGFRGSGMMEILGLLFEMMVMFCLWGYLIFQITNLAKWVSARLSQGQRKVARWGLGVVALILLTTAISAMQPETPRPFLSSAEVKTVADGNNAFAVDLYHKLKKQPGNLFFSPYSISASLAMTRSGARGQTETEMTHALHLNLPQDRLHSAFKALVGRINSIQRWNRIELKSANSLWCQKDYPFKETFLKPIRDDFSAEAKPVDFKKAGGSADEINRWIDENTNHKIQGGIGPCQLTRDTRLALCSAIYFKGTWLHQFDKKDTKSSPFYVSTNETITVPMMSQSAEFKHAMTEDASVEMLELPYSGHDLSMVILLPVRGIIAYHDLQELEQELTAENLRHWLALLDGSNLHKTSVRLPRFLTRSSFTLAKDLKALGMASAFDDTADFSGMDGTKNLYLSDVFHKAFVDVNEAGTEAAAINLSLVMTKSMDDRFTVDHPFIFLIRENGSGSILFLGRILNPTK